MSTPQWYVPKLGHQETLLAVYFVLLSTVGCRSEIRVHTVGNAAPQSMQVTGRHPVVAQPGERVTLSGTGFKSGMTLSLAGASAKGEPLAVTATVEGPASARFDVPAGAASGLNTLTVMQDGQSQVVTLVFAHDAADEIIFARSSSAICQGLSYYDLDGNLRQGSRSCGPEDLGAPGTKDCTEIPKCSKDGEVGCITIAAFPAIDKNSTKLPAKIKSGESVVGIAGAYVPDFPDLANVKSSDTVNGAKGELSDCSGAAQSGCVATATYKTMDLGSAGGATGLTSTNFDDAIATASDFEFWDSSGARHTITGDSDLSAANIKLSTEIHGKTGTIVETVANCSSNGSQNCVATGSYKAATTCSGDDSNCYIPTYVQTTQPLKAISYDSIDSGKGSILSSLTLSGIAGTYSPDFPDPANVRTTDTTNTAPGTLADCSADGSTGCVTTSTYKSADLTNVVSGNLKNGVTIAGVVGSYPSLTTPLALNNAGVTDLTSFGPATDTGIYEFFDSTGAVHSAIIADGGTVTPTTSDQTISAAGTMYRSVVVAGDGDLVASNIKNTANIFGVGGNVTGSPANCSSNGGQDCVATGSYKAATTCFGDDSNCYVPTYVQTTQPLKAISYDSIDSGKGSILSSLTLSGIAGTYSVTLPAVGKVLTGIQYGVGGTGLEGTLTLPDAASVLSGSGTYGDPASPLTPSLPNNITLIARPNAPTITATSFDQGPDSLTITWSSVTDATGYIVLLRSGAAVSWTPTDFNTYTTGTYDSDTMIYSGSNTTVTYETPITAGTTYYIAIYSHQVNKVYSYLPSTKTILSCASLTGGTWIPVPGDSVYGTSGFCVQKYIPSNVSSVPTSQTGTNPWVGINQTSFKTACESLGAGYHLITNPEWMTIAANIAAQASNWSNGVVGSGTLSRGHSDNSPASACPADASDANGWVETNCTGQTQGALAFNQRRTQNLSNGEVIWDIGGNVYQWVDYNNPNDKPTPASAGGYEFTAMTGSTTTPMSHLVPLNSAQSWWDDTWDSTESIGKINPGFNASGGAMLRGASRGSGSEAGPFAVDLYNVPSFTDSNFSGRCAWTP